MKPDQIGIIDSLPSALERKEEIITRISGKTPVVFLDYDGTLTPIVDDPAKATLSDNVREIINRLADTYSVAIISGRDLKDLQKMVGIDNIAYAGSHGFDIVSPKGFSRNLSKGEPFLGFLDDAEKDLRSSMEKIEGARVERKRFAIAVHYRQMDETVVPEFERIFDEVLDQYPQLRKTGGKKVFEMRPNIEWDKGSAIKYLMETFCSNNTMLIPIYIGDDITDEDVFDTIHETGIGIVVGTGQRVTKAHYRLYNTGETIQFLKIIKTYAGKRTAGEHQ